MTEPEAKLAELLEKPPGELREMLGKWSLVELTDRRDLLQHEKNDNSETITRIRGQLDVREANAMETGIPFDDAWALRAKTAARHRGRYDQALATKLGILNREIKQRTHQHNMQTEYVEWGKCFMDAARAVLSDETFRRIMLHAQLLKKAREDVTDDEESDGQDL